jgi:CRISPR-associated endonuclease Cas2
MGKLERDSSRRARKNNLQQIILSTVKLSGLIAVGLVAPNVIGAMKKLGLVAAERQNESIQSSASKMAKVGLLKFNGKYYELTKKGEERLRRWELQEFKFIKPKTWDRKWRVIIFDIPENRRAVRNRVRNLFKEAGFLSLQKSVWVYPYDCEDIITLMKTNLGVGKDILYMIVDEIENDRHLRKEFGLI